MVLPVGAAFVGTKERLATYATPTHLSWDCNGSLDAFVQNCQKEVSRHVSTASTLIAVLAAFVDITWVH